MFTENMLKLGFVCAIFVSSILNSICNKLSAIRSIRMERDFHFFFLTSDSLSNICTLIRLFFFLNRNCMNFKKTVFYSKETISYSKNTLLSFIHVCCASYKEKVICSNHSEYLAMNRQIIKLNYLLFLVLVT